MVAVAVNQSCIARTDFEATLVRDGDEIEVLAPMAGG
jgi:thiamine biosynthesis protein ThiS